MEGARLREDEICAAQQRLGYSLDREEALGYLVTSALHMPLLSPEEARTIGKRAGSLPIFSKLAEFKKRGTTASIPRSPACRCLPSLHHSASRRPIHRGSVSDSVRS